MNKVDLTKPVQTRDGRKARIICTDMASPFPVVFLYTDPETGVERTASCNEQGVNLYGRLDLDLVNIPEETAEFVNVYGTGCGGCAYSSKADADRAADDNRVAVIKVTWAGEHPTKVEFV